MIASAACIVDSAKFPVRHMPTAQRPRPPTVRFVPKGQTKSDRAALLYAARQEVTPFDLRLELE